MLHVKRYRSRLRARANDVNTDVKLSYRRAIAHASHASSPLNGHANNTPDALPRPSTPMIFITRHFRAERTAARCAIAAEMGTRDCLGNQADDTPRAFMTRRRNFESLSLPLSLSLFLTIFFLLAALPPSRPARPTRHREGGSRRRPRDKSGWPADLRLSCRIIARGLRARTGYIRKLISPERRCALEPV